MSCVKSTCSHASLSASPITSEVEWMNLVSSVLVSILCVATFTSYRW